MQMYLEIFCNWSFKTKPVFNLLRSKANWGGGGREGDNVKRDRP